MITLLDRLLGRLPANPGRELALIGAAKRRTAERSRVHHKACLIREAFGLPPSPALQSPRKGSAQ